MQPTLPDTAGKNYAVCPYLGVSDDPGTALRYPTASNYCHHAKPIASIRSTHQTKYCLCGEFEKCPVFKTQGNQPLPANISASIYHIRRRLPAIVLSIALILVLVVVLFSIDMDGSKLMNSPQNEQELNVQALQTITQMAHLTQTGIAQASVPSLTPEPTSSFTEIPATPYPTSFPPHTLEVPFGVDPRFVIHKVQVGESFMRFMQDYNTTKEAIVAVNYAYDSVLWADSILIIPVDVTDATGLPSFSAYQVTDLNQTVEMLADNQGVDLGLLKKFNALPEGYIFSEGEWVLLPR